MKVYVPCVYHGYAVSAVPSMGVLPAIGDRVVPVLHLAGCPRLTFMLAFPDLLDQFGAEGRQILRLATGDQTIVDDHLPVDPGAPCIANIGAQTGPGRESAAPHDI